MRKGEKEGTQIHILFSHRIQNYATHVRSVSWIRRLMNVHCLQVVVFLVVASFCTTCMFLYYTVHGSEITNVQYLNFICTHKDIAAVCYIWPLLSSLYNLRACIFFQMWASHVFAAATNLFSWNGSVDRFLGRAYARLKYVVGRTGCIEIKQ